MKVFKFIQNPIAQKISLIALGIIISVTIILNVPEGSNLQIILPFFIGGLFGYENEKTTSKIDVLFHYIILIVFFIFWFFLVPNKLQSIFFILGALIARSLKRDLNSLI